MVSFRAPGRVNLIGEHTDYSDGFCLPVAIDRECRITSTPAAAARICATSSQLDGTVELDLAGRPVGDLPRWGGFVAGAVTTLTAAGHRVDGADLIVDSSVPAGAGLSSSSALSVALILALLPPGAPVRADPRELARLALAAEIATTGLPSGIMDQLASLGGRAGHALLLDCRTLTVEPVALPPDLAILVVHSGLPRELADSEYAQRAHACAAAAARLGLRALRDATLDQVRDDPVARHVVSENARVLACCDAMRSGDLEQVGRLLLAGHASLRDDFRVSTPELDLLVDAFLQAGALGARLTGAGFGGCVVGLTTRDRADACLAATVETYRTTSGQIPTGFRVEAVAGAGEITEEGQG